MAAKSGGLDLSGVGKKKGSTAGSSSEDKNKKNGGADNTGSRLDLLKPKNIKESLVGTDDKDAAADADDEILSGIASRGKNKTGLLFGAIAVALVVVVIFVFLIAGGTKDPGGASSPSTNVGNNQQVQRPVQQAPQNSQTGNTGNTAAPNTSGSQQAGTGNDVGWQDFTGNTNMTNSDVLTNPEKYVQDIYGLTVRVDYEVKQISYATDFVNYTKHRGTWGGGIELYWLDVEYKGTKYVIQIPFKYYKELDNSGIVPVRMEVCTIAGNTAKQDLTVITYMTLDANTLQALKKN